MELTQQQKEFLVALGIEKSFMQFVQEGRLEEARTLLLKTELQPEGEKYIKKLIQLNHTRTVTVSEAIIRPTGLLDPIVVLKPVKNQVDDVLEQVRQRVAKKQRVIITTLTKRFAEDLDVYCKELNIHSAYIHSDIDALQRLDIISDLRRGAYDVLIGINLLREGLDLPEVSLVAIFDADKEGFLRSKTSLIQIIGRAARHVEGTVIMYADTVTQSMRQAIAETERRRQLQQEYNQKHGIVPKTVKRELNNLSDEVKAYNAEFEIQNQEKTTEHVDSMNIVNKNARGGRYRNKKGEQSTDRVRYDPGKQLYADFEYQKAVEMRNITESGMTREQLMIELDIAINQQNFEKAAAIRDFIKNRS